MEKKADESVGEEKEKDRDREVEKVPDVSDLDSLAKIMNSIGRVYFNMVFSTMHFTEDPAMMAAMDHMQKFAVYSRRVLIVIRFFRTRLAGEEVQLGKFD